MTGRGPNRGAATKEISGERQVHFRRCRITVTLGPDAGKSLETDRPLVRIGTAADNDLVLTDEAVSRHHLSLLKRGGEYAVVDEGSTNGTWIGELRVKEAVLHHRGEIQLGDTLIAFEPLSTEVAIVPSPRARFGPVVGGSPAMRAVIGALERVSKTDLPVLVEGEVGTGKSLVASALHGASGRGAFVVFDCGALPERMARSALLGEPGTFPGALEQADGGSLLLDRVEALEPELQADLLSALERREAPGGARFDVRVLSASTDLGGATDEGRFSPELFYRLAVVRLELPPLRARPEDLPALVEAILADLGLGPERLEKSAWTALERHLFPGNVRELENALRVAAAVAGGGPIGARELNPALGAGADPRSAGPLDLPDASMPFKDAKARVLDAFERRYLLDLLGRHAFNISRASREAGIDRRHLYRLLEKYGLDTKGA